MDGDMDTHRRCSPVSRSRRIAVMPRIDPEMLISVMLKGPSETAIPCGSSESPAATASSEADFDPDVVAGDKSEAATNGPSRVRLDVPGWWGCTLSIMRGSKKLLGMLRTEGGRESSNSDSKVIPVERSLPPSTTSYSKDDFHPDIIVRDNSEAATDRSSRDNRDAPGRRGSRRSLIRGSRKLLAKLRAEGGGMESSNFDGDVIPFDRNSNPLSATSVADFDPHHVHRDNSEAATDGSSTLKLDFPATRSPMRNSKNLSAKLLAEGKSPNSDVMSSEEAPRQELASKLEENCTNACEGGQKRNSQPTAFQDDEPPIARSKLQVQQQPGRRKEGLHRALKGVVCIQTRVKMLCKSKPDEYRRKVVVNGVPIKDVDVKKAEESAGPIHPGSYWYDIHAGFWGVEPGPCLGIIPPCILELNVPMSKGCAGGDTSVLVNGRELHEKDLERLSLRGLPTTPGMAYCISIDGRVMDESSGKHVMCLGMLAPSLRKIRRGAGIYMPCVCVD